MNIYQHKSPILVFLFISFLSFAQEVKPCLFIGTYEINKRGICGDYEMVHEQVMDYADFVIKRIQFQEEHKTQSPNTKFIDKNESVIAYQYEKKISGWGCNSDVISTKTGKSIEDCNQQLADQMAKYPKDFTTQPKIIFTWQGTGKSIAQYTTDFGGLKGTFTSANTATKTIIVAQLKNNLQDKIAYIYLKTDSGAETVEYINPGATFTNRYVTKNLEIKVIYLDKSKPKPTVDMIQKMKDWVGERITNKEEAIKGVVLAGVGVRG